MPSEIGKPGPNWKQVGPDARKKLSPLIRHYMKNPHPFTSCVRDNTKRFGKDRAERVCAVLKDLGHGGTGWRKGGKRKMQEAVEDALVALHEAGVRDAHSVALIEEFMLSQLEPADRRLVEGQQLAESHLDEARVEGYTRRGPRGKIIRVSDHERKLMTKVVAQVRGTSSARLKGGEIATLAKMATPHPGGTLVHSGSGDLNKRILAGASGPGGGVYTLDKPLDVSAREGGLGMYGKAKLHVEVPEGFPVVNLDEQESAMTRNVMFAQEQARVLLPHTRLRIIKREGNELWVRAEYPEGKRKKLAEALCVEEAFWGDGFAGRQLAEAHIEGAARGSADPDPFRHELDEAKGRVAGYVRKGARGKVVRVKQHERDTLYPDQNEEFKRRFERPTLYPDQNEEFRRRQAAERAAVRDTSSMQDWAAEQARKRREGGGLPPPPASPGTEKRSATERTLLDDPGVAPLYGQETRRAAAQRLEDLGLGKYDAVADTFTKPPPASPGTGAKPGEPKRIELKRGGEYVWGTVTSEQGGRLRVRLDGTDWEIDATPDQDVGGDYLKDAHMKRTLRPKLSESDEFGAELARAHVADSARLRGSAQPVPFC